MTASLRSSGSGSSATNPSDTPSAPAAIPVQLAGAAPLPWRASTPVQGELLPVPFEGHDTVTTLPAPRSSYGFSRYRWLGFLTVPRSSPQPEAAQPTPRRRPRSPFRLGAIALTCAAALAVTGCGNTNTNAHADLVPTAAPTGLRIATLLPISGSLKLLLPGAQAGIAQALVDIDSAGGVLGLPVEVMQESDEGDVIDGGTVDRAADEIIKSGASFVVGPLGSSRAVRSVHKITEAGVLMGSPANSDVVLSGINPLYFRVAATDTELGDVLAAEIIANGATSVAFLTMKDRDGFGLRDAAQRALEAGGVPTVYGATGKHQEFALNQLKFTTEVTAVQASGAEAIVIVTFDQVENVITELVKQGVDMTTVYLVDGNTIDHSETQKAGVLEGAHGMIPGAPPEGRFREQLKEIYQKTYGKELRSFAYAGEAYDTVMLAALAAEKAGATDAESIAAQLGPVSGATGGKTCETFRSCVALIKQGAEIHYLGKSGAGPLTSKNEPSSVLVGMFVYDAKNVPVFRAPTIEVPAKP